MSDLTVGNRFRRGVRGVRGEAEDAEKSEFECSLRDLCVSVRSALKEVALVRGSQ